MAHSDSAALVSQASRPVRQPSATQDPAQLEVQKSFQKSCTACHANFSALDQITKNAPQIATRLDWTQPDSMPPEGSSQRAELAAHPEQLSAMKKFVARVVADRPENTSGLPLDKIQLPPGFRISVYAKVPGARSMTLSPSGTLYVGTGGLSGNMKRVYAVGNLAGDGVIQVKTILDGLDVPNGVAFKDGDLYVAEVSRILRYRDIEHHLDHPPAPVVFGGSFSTNHYHGWKFIRFAPDGSLIVPVGAPCNICQPDDQHASIFRISPDGGKTEKIAQGVRNTVGFDFHPKTGDLYFSDNGRDMLGEDIPTDEVNVLKKGKGLTHYGYPYCHAGKILDPQFGTGHTCSEFQSPILDIPAHSAALGLRFYTGQMFPESFRNQIFMAEHGSWNRKIPQGYQVDFISTPDGGKTFNTVPFAKGWLKEDGTAWGRPVDVEVLARDGSLLISDDSAGVIYRVSYEPLRE